MKINKIAIVVSVFAIVLGLALAGGAWTSSYAAGTIPPVPVIGGGGGGGGGAGGGGGGGAGAGAGGVAGVPGFIPVTGGATLTEVGLPTLPNNEDVEACGLAYNATSGGQISITDPTTLKCYKTNPESGFLFFDGTKWIKLTTTLVNGVLTATLPGEGYIAFGTLP